MSRTPLGPGVRVRYVGRPHQPYTVLLLMLHGQIGRIDRRSCEPEMDWHVVMEEGIYDLDAAAGALEPIDEEPELIVETEEAEA